jgi:hypothetical protein
MVFVNKKPLNESWSVAIRHGTVGKQFFYRQKSYQTKIGKCLKLISKTVICEIGVLTLLPYTCALKKSALVARCMKAGICTMRAEERRAEKIVLPNGFSYEKCFSLFSWYQQPGLPIQMGEQMLKRACSFWC